MEQLAVIIISLTSNAVKGRYRLRYQLHKIIKETAKTIVVQKSHHEHRYHKDLILKPQSDFRNEKLASLQYYLICYEKDIQEGSDILRKTISNKIEVLKEENIRALDAFNSHCVLEKN